MTCAPAPYDFICRAPQAQPFSVPSPQVQAQMADAFNTLFERATRGMRAVDPGTLAMIGELNAYAINGLMTRAELLTYSGLLMTYLGTIPALWQQYSMRALAGSQASTTGHCCESCAQGGPCAGDVARVYHGHPSMARVNGSHTGMVPSACAYGGGCVPQWVCP